MGGERETADVLAFAPHPDDAEIGAGGTLARHCRLGYEVVVCDLTLGELASNGDPETRVSEANAAARVLGLAARETLGLGDRALEPTPERVQAVAAAVRRWRPRVVLAPLAEDRHPDHEAANRLVREGVFSAGLARYRAPGEPWRVSKLVFYFVNARTEPEFVVDVSDVYEVKRAALAAYASQFAPARLEQPRTAGLGASPAAGGPGVTRPAAPRAGGRRHPTPLTEGYLGWVELRDAWYGSLAGVARAEGFCWEGTLAVADLVRQL